MDEETLDELFDDEDFLQDLRQKLFAPKLCIPVPEKIKEVRRLQSRLTELLSGGLYRAKVDFNFSTRNPQCAVLTFRVDNIRIINVQAFTKILQICGFIETRQKHDGVYMDLLIPGICKIAILTEQGDNTNNQF